MNQRVDGRKSPNPVEDRRAWRGRGDQHEGNLQERRRIASHNFDLYSERLSMPKGGVQVWETWIDLH